MDLGVGLDGNACPRGAGGASPAPTARGDGRRCRGMMDLGVGLDDSACPRGAPKSVTGWKPLRTKELPADPCQSRLLGSVFEEG
jgi:hypothetical protein